MGDAINGVVNGVAVGVNDVIAALAPFGIGLTLILITLVLLFLGASYLSGSTAFVAPLLRFLGVGTGTGKTTLLRALLREVAGHERLLILEDTQELALDGFNVVHLRTALNVTLADLLQHAMRKRPDRIVVGEVRGPEALGAVIAMNSGHDGTLLTLHSNGLEEALARLHTLGSMGWPGLPYEWVVRAVDGVVQLEGRGQERRLQSIWEVPRSYERPVSRRASTPPPA